MPAPNSVAVRTDSLDAPVNPFETTLNVGPSHMAKVAIFGVVLIPLRLLLFLILLLIASLVTFIAQLGLKPDDYQKPFSGWRKSLMSSLPYLARTLLFVFGFHYIPRHGKLAPISEAPILCVAPHSSFVDFLLVFSDSWACGVSRIENGRIPVLGAIVSSTQPIYVDRTDKSSRANTFLQIKERAQSGLWRIMIFPEGTTTNRKCLVTFKTGAFGAGMPVQPVVLQYHNRHLDLAWVPDGPKAIRIFLLMLAQPNNSASISYLPVYHPNSAEQADPQLFARAVRAKMAAYLGVPVTEHSYEDIRLMYDAQKADLPFSAGVVEFDKLNKRIGLNYQEMANTLSQFASLSPNHDGELTIEEFATALGLPVSDPVRKVFEVYDRDGNGTINFREFVIGRMLASMPHCADDTIRLAFDTFDTRNAGGITKDDLSSMLRVAFPFITEKQVSNLFERADTRKTGLIDYEDLQAFLVKNPEYTSVIDSLRSAHVFDEIREERLRRSPRRSSLRRR